jgi:chromosome partitioning protein
VTVCDQLASLGPLRLAGAAPIPRGRRIPELSGWMLQIDGVTPQKLVASRRPEGSRASDDFSASKRRKLRSLASFEAIMPSALNIPSARRIMFAHMDETANGAPIRRRGATIDDLLELAGRAKDVLVQARKDSLRPENKKTLRLFTMSEICALLGIHPTKFYEAVADRPELQGTRVKGKRYYTLAEIHTLQEQLKQLPRQRYNIRQAVAISIANFKGGVAKTFTAVTLSQYLAMRGYRTLVIDTDPQASLTSCFGLDPSQVDDTQTILPYLYGRERVEAFGFEWPKSFHSSIQPTYWSRLDLCAANLTLYSGEFALGLRREESKGTDRPFHFHRPLHDAIESVRSEYDVIIIDNPPALSLSTTGAIYAADGLILPTGAETLDFESAEAFMQMASEILKAVRKSFGDEKELELFRILITKFQGRDAEKKIARRILSVFGDYCIQEPMVQSATVQKSASNWRTLYEEDPRGKGRSVLKRAVDAANLVNKEIEDDLIQIFAQRRRQAEAPRQVAA